MTGGRINRVKKYVGNEPFLLNYGDGLSDVNILDTIEAHKKSGKVLSMMAYQPSGKLGVLEIDDRDDSVLSFKEKPDQGGAWINAGFFVCEPELFDYLGDDTEMFERQPMERIMAAKQLHAYKHNGFWKAMDTLNDNKEFNKLWDAGNAPWKNW